MTEAGRSAHQFTEVASRARGNFTDVRMALIEMGEGEVSDSPRWMLTSQVLFAGTDLTKLKAHSQRARRMQVNKRNCIYFFIYFLFEFY